jgi:hypothetical protein
MTDNADGTGPAAGSETDAAANKSVCECHVMSLVCTLFVVVNIQRPTISRASYVQCNNTDYHRLGDKQSDDTVIFAALDHPQWMPVAEVSNDG